MLVDLALADGPWSERRLHAGGDEKTQNTLTHSLHGKHAQGQSTAVNAHRSARAIVAHEAKIERMKGRQKLGL